MKKNKHKIIEIIVLITAVISLSIGFAAFSGTLKVDEKKDDKKKKDDYAIILSAKEELHHEDEVVGVSSTGNSYGLISLLDNKNSMIADLKAFFRQTGEEVTYTFYAHNVGNEDVYLDSIIFTNIEDKKFYKECKAVYPKTTNLNLVSAACEGISLEVDVNGEFVTEGSVSEIKDLVLGKGESDKITVTIKYNSDAAYVDGDFIVEFGKIKMTYISDLEYDFR